MHRLAGMALVRAALVAIAIGCALLVVPHCAVAAADARTWWRPVGEGPDSGPEFQLELDHALSVGSTSDMGVGALNAAGRTASNPKLYDIDGIANPASTVAALHRRGDRVICYVEIGAAGNYYPAGQEHLPVSYYAQLRRAGDLGSAVPGYPESYLDINAASTVLIIESMIRQQCGSKGFDAVDPDIDDSYTDHTGFAITETENLIFDKTLAAYSHSLGLAWGQKNGDDDPRFSSALEPVADFLLDEECNYYRTCRTVAGPYLRAGKLVMNVEYTDDWGDSVGADLRRFCPEDDSAHIDGVLFTVMLAGERNPCR